MSIFGDRIGCRKFGYFAAHGQIGDDYGDFMIRTYRMDSSKSFSSTFSQIEVHFLMDFGGRVDSERFRRIHDSNIG